MSDQLELMFDLLQQEVEKFTADLARGDSDVPLNSNHQKQDTISETPSINSLEDIKSELLFDSITFSSDVDDDGLSNFQLQLFTNPSNSHQRSSSYNDSRNLEIPSLHQKSNSMDSRYVDSEHLLPSSRIDSTQLNYQRIRSLSSDSNNAVAVPIISPMLSPRIIPKSPSILSSDSDSDISVSSSDDTSGSDSDSDDSPLMTTSMNLLRNHPLKDLSSIQNSSPVDEQLFTVPSESGSTTSFSTNTFSSSSSTGSRLSFDNGKKKLKRTPTTGRGLVKSPISHVNDIETDDENLPLKPIQDVKDDDQKVGSRVSSKIHESKDVKETSTDVNKSNSYDTDDEDRPLRSKVNSNSNLDKKTVRPRANSRAQELKNVKNVNEILKNVNKSDSYDTDDENRPLKSKVNSNSNLDKKTVRSRANSRAQELKSVNEILKNVNKSDSHDTDDENRPLRINIGSKIQDTINLEKKREEKQTVRSRAKSVSEILKNVNKSSLYNTDDENRPLKLKSNLKDVNLDIQIVRPRSNSNLDTNKDSPVRMRRQERSSDDSMETSRLFGSKERGRGRSRSRERNSDDVPTRSDKLRGFEHTEERRDRSRSRDRGSDEYKYRENRERGNSQDHEADSRGRFRSRARDDVNSEKILERRPTKAKSKTREPEDKEQIRSRNNDVEKEGRRSNRNEEDNDRGKARSRVRGEEDRARSRSKAREEERGRARSKPREEERGRAKSNPKEREVEERGGRAKSRTRENDNRERAKSRTRDRDREYELLDKEKNSRYRREKVETHEEPKITEVKLTAQIYIEELGQYKKLLITSTRTALDVLKYFRKSNIISSSESLSLFEVLNGYGLERPIRDWEYIATVIGTWELNKQNLLVLKKHNNRNCLTIEGFNNAFPLMFGWLHWEVKKNKWQKRHFYIRDGAVYHCKDSKGNNETLLCSLANFDVYTFTKPVKKSPTKFMFALKSQDNIAMFENTDDYMHYLCAEHFEKMNDWVMSIRSAKNNLTRAENPERFIEKLSESDLERFSPIGENSFELSSRNENSNKASGKLKSMSQWDNLRKYVRNSYSKSEDNLLGIISTGLKKKESYNGLKESSNNAMATSGFKEGPLLNLNEKNQSSKQVESESSTFAKGSLLASNDTLYEQAKEREKLRKAMGGLGIVRDPNSSTFVNLDNSVKFNQGSLLGRNNDTTEYNNNSGHLVQIENGVQFNKGSLLTKSNEKNNNTQRLHKNPSGTLLKIDAPLSRSASAQNLLTPNTPNGKTLLELDLKPDAAHTIALRNTNIKPLLSFVPGESKTEGLKSPRVLLKNNDETDSEYDNE